MSRPYPGHPDCPLPLAALINSSRSIAWARGQLDLRQADHCHFDTSYSAQFSRALDTLSETPARATTCWFGDGGH